MGIGACFAIAIVVSTIEIAWGTYFGKTLEKQTDTGAGRDHSFVGLGLGLDGQR